MCTWLCAHSLSSRPGTRPGIWDRAYGPFQPRPHLACTPPLSHHVVAPDRAWAFPQHLACVLVHCQVASWHQTRHRPAVGRLQQHHIIGGASPPCACPCHVPYKYIEYICYVPRLLPHMHALPAVFHFATSTATTATTAKAIMALHCTLSGVVYRVCAHLCACPLSRRVVPPCHVQSGTFSMALVCAWRSVRVGDPTSAQAGGYRSLPRCIAPLLPDPGKCWQRPGRTGRMITKPHDLAEG